MSDVPVPEVLLDYEKLDVYRCSLQFLQLSVRMLALVPKREVDLRSQLRRASTSIPLNIAEGTGKPGVADRARFYSIARGSAMECGAVLDVLTASSMLPSEMAREGRDLIVRIVSMLTRLSR